MSQHTLITKKEGCRIRISIGWDRPLQGYFMNIWQLAPNCTEQLLYESLSDQTLNMHGHTDNLDDFVTKLEELRIPGDHLDAVLESVYLDGVFNEGNRVVDHTRYITINESLKGLASEVSDQLAWPAEATGCSDLNIFASNGQLVHTVRPSVEWSDQSLRATLAEDSPQLPAELLCSRQAIHVFLGPEWIASTGL